jgi:hypothetical protein
MLHGLCINSILLDGAGKILGVLQILHLLSSLICLGFLLILAFGTEYWPQGLAYARQVLYHLSYFFFGF